MKPIYYLSKSLSGQACERLSRSRNRFALSGFTLVELLVGMSIGMVALTAIAAILLSDLRNQRRAENLSVLRANWSLAFNLIEAEAQIADRILISSTVVSCGSAVLTFSGAPDNWSTTYGIRAVTSGEADKWRGPFVLIRCGKPFNFNASELSVDASGLSVETVVVDGLPNSTAFSLEPLPNSASGTVARDAEATLSLSVGDAAFQNSFRLRLPSNPIYGLQADVLLGLQACNQSTSAPCLQSTLPNGEGRAREWYVTSSGSVIGDDTDEDIVYFNYPSTSATFSSSCDRASCVVSVGPLGEVTVKNVDVLSFTDREIRL